MMASLSNTARYRWRVASRVLAAVMGGYALTSAATVLLALVWPLPQAEAVAAVTMLSFTLYTVVILWIFAVKRLRTLWLTVEATNGEVYHQRFDIQRLSPAMAHFIREDI